MFLVSQSVLIIKRTRLVAVAAEVDVRYPKGMDLEVFVDLI